MTTFLDLYRGTHDQLYSYVAVKDKILYLAADITTATTVLTLASQNIAREIREGQILELSTETGVTSEMVRVVTVDAAANTVTVRRGVAGTIAAAWTAVASLIRVDPEYPMSRILTQINNVITGLPPDLWAMRVFTTTGSAVTVGYQLPAGAVGVSRVASLSVGPGNEWYAVHRWRWDQANRTVLIYGPTSVGQSLQIVYRSYPTALVSAADDLVLVSGLPDSTSQLIQWGALYRLLLGRAAGRLVDTRAETPLNQQYRQADPVTAAVRQIFALYQERLDSERARQRLEYPPRPYLEF